MQTKKLVYLDGLKGLGCVIVFQADNDTFRNKTQIQNASEIQ